MSGRRRFTRLLAIGALVVLAGFLSLAQGEWATWETKAPMRNRRAVFATAVLEGEIWAIGGYARGLNRGVMEIYNPQKDSWRTMDPFPLPMNGLTAGVVDGKIYVFGGSVMAGDRTDVAIPKVEVYDPVSDTWEERRPMPTAVAGAGAAVVGSKVYLVGGASVVCLHTSQNRPLSQVYIYDPATDRWREATPLPTPRAQLGVAFVDNTIYTFGSSTFGCGVTNVNEALYLED